VNVENNGIIIPGVTEPLYQKDKESKACSVELHPSSNSIHRCVLFY